MVTAGELAGKLGISLTVSGDTLPLRASLASATSEKTSKKTRQPSASVRSARASAKAQMRAEGLKKQNNDFDQIQVVTEPTKNEDKEGEDTEE